jgi:hypothetical protein
MATKNQAAVEQGRRGGTKRAANLTPEQRSESPRIASIARWGWQRKKVS